jgi:dCMP deaminase
MDAFNRPDWDSYFMAMAFLTAQRSIDPSTKHGCIITKNHKVIGVGYNGPPQGLDDSQIPLTRPEKYLVLSHAEENGITNSDQSDLRGTTVYITGYPCSRCFRMLLNKQVGKIIYGCVGSKMLDQNDLKATSLMLSIQKNSNPTQLIAYSGDKFIEVLKNTVKCFEEKCGGQGLNTAEDKY